MQKLFIIAAILTCAIEVKASEAPINPDKQPVECSRSATEGFQGHSGGIIAAPSVNRSGPPSRGKGPSGVGTPAQKGVTKP